MQKDIDRARRYLTEQRGRLAEVSAEIGVSRSWVSKFISGARDNPTFRQLQKVLDHMKRTGART